MAMRTSGRLAELVEATTARRASTDPDLALPLLRSFVDWVEDACDERYRMQFEDQALVEQLVDTFHFVQQRKKNALLVRTVLVEHGPERRHERNTMLEVLLPDQPFVVDTIRLFLEFTGMRVISSLYVALPLGRGRSGSITAFDPRHHGDTPELLVRFELAGSLRDEFREHLERAVRERLEIARAVVSDFRRMKSCLKRLARVQRRALSYLPESEQEIVQDARLFVEWLMDDFFILMGISFHPIDGVTTTESNLGHALLPEDEQARCAERIAAMLAATEGSERWVKAYKSQEESLIHRAGKIDNFLLRAVDEKGQLRGVYQVRGLFTFKAIKTPGSQIPLLRMKLDELTGDEDQRSGSLGWKAIINAFDSIPVEFLFEAPTAEIQAIVETILYVEKAKELRAHVTVDHENRKALYFLVLPRHGYSEDLRRRIESVLIEGLGATYSDSRVYIGKFESILLTFFFTAAERFKEFSRKELDDRVRAVAGTWEERLLRELVSRSGHERAQTLWDRYHRAFSDEYQLQHSMEEAAQDIEQLEQLATEPESVGFAILVSPRDRAQRRARLRIYLRRNVFLSQILPILDNFGLQIVDQLHFRMLPSSGEELFINSFRVAGIDGDRHPLLSGRETVIEALAAVFARRVANDPLNKLVVLGGCSWQDVDVLRAFLSYLRQLGVGATFQFMSNALRQHIAISQLLLELFHVRLDPDLDLDFDQRLERSGAIEDSVRESLKDVPSSAQDQFFRLLMNLITCVLRTNRYLGNRPQHYLSFKIDSLGLMVGGDPRLWREIYVHHYAMEGIHLRGSELARGGIRWSERLSDYREEVLGLMRTQMVKNVIIVPQGAKGGFVVRRPSQDPDQRRAQVDNMYRLFINGLLDVTDNVVDGMVAAPERVIAYDVDDPYLVVAADKGTAHLSDVANAISRERGFWLGDAFASGGSQGYDHKALAITARGAWEGVKRHFREIEIDPDRDPFTAVGIGDMSGDVFGNGMLLSRNLRLVGAFNHQHIFIDPDPDPERSFAERSRLFALPRSSWSDYDKDALSDGGGVYSRHAKSIVLSPEASALLGLDGEGQRPEDVIRSMLTLEVDLLWNGGIGTYVRASSEDDREVGDLSNQGVRVSATRLRARVVAEGGNLGVTQAGRVQYSLLGGRINTDFVDNSGGVDCSDHEVNLKILLDPLVVAGKLTEAERNQLLASLASVVCEQVLNNNRSQGLVLSLDELRSRQDLFAFERTIKALEDRGLAVRERDRLPDLEAVLSRQAQEQGMTRPELALITAYCKMDVYRRLLEMPDGTIPGQAAALRRYFPAALVERFSDSLEGHLLGRQIALTTITNEVIDRAGATFFYDVERESGASLDRIVTAYLLARDLTGTSRLVQQITALDNTVPARSQHEAIQVIEEAIRRAVAWLLSANDPQRLQSVTDRAEAFRAQLERYWQQLPGSLSDLEQRRVRDQEEHARRGQLPDEITTGVMRIGYLTAGLTCADIALTRDRDVADITNLYFKVGNLSYLIPFARSWEDKVFQGRWDTLALRIIRNTVLESLRGLTMWLIDELGAGSGHEWVDRGVELVKQNPRVEELKKDLKRLTAAELSISSLVVAAENLRRFYAR